MLVKIWLIYCFIWTFMTFGYGYLKYGRKFEFGTLPFVLSLFVFGIVLFIFREDLVVKN